MSNVDKEVRIKELKETLSRASADLAGLQLGSEYFQPLYPWVLVWVLPADMMKIGSIYAPDVKKTNRVTREGIVIRTWKPFYREFKQRNDGVNAPDFRPIETRERLAKPVLMKSELMPGDQVVFPHWAGMNDSRLSDKEFRYVKEHTTYNPPDNVFAKLEVEQEDVAKTIKKMLSSFEDPVDGGKKLVTGAYTSLKVKELLEKFYIVPRLGQTPRIMPGEAHGSRETTHAAGTFTK